MSDSPPQLLVVAHGTRSTAGSATTSRLIDALRESRPALRIELCFLDVAAPSLPDALAAEPTLRTVLVPLLLSTGYHVQHDIPAAVAAYPEVRVARHLGPDELLTDALVDRLRAAGADATAAILLVAAGSSQAEAAVELTQAAALLERRRESPVSVATMADDLVAAIGRLPAPSAVATYLLAEGQFTETLHAAAAGRAVVADPIGVHRALVELVLRRYDDVVRAN